MVRIGDFEFAAHPGYVGMRKLPLPLWIYAVLQACVSVLIWWNSSRTFESAITAIFFMAVAIYLIVKRRNLTLKPLVEWRDGRLYIRSEDAGSAEGISIAVNAEKRRFVVLARWPGQPRRPHLVWWTQNEKDANQLRDLIATAIPVTANVWPPPPTLPVEP